MSNFNLCLNQILGYCDYNTYGITEKAYQNWKKSPMPKAGISRTEAALFYKENHWNLLSCGELPKGVDLVVFNLSIMAGPYKAAIKLQQTVGTMLTGKVNSETVETVKAHHADLVINRYKDLSLAFRPYEETRINNITALALTWLPKEQESTLDFFSDESTSSL